MRDDQIEAIRESLDAALAVRPAASVIALGLKLFEEFRLRGWLAIRDFEAMGEAPAYHETHLAFPNWNLPEMEFSVGDDRGKPATQRRALFGSPWAGY
jgi:hypothetical protein